MLLPFIHETPPSLLEDLPGKEDLNELPVYEFRAGPNNESRRIVMITSYTSSKKAVKSIRSELKQSIWLGMETGAAEYRFLGFDIESKPKFQKGGKQAVAMVQLATQSTAYLFRTKFEGMGEADRGKGAWTPELSNLLSDPNIIKIGAGVDGDMKSLRDFYGSGCYRQESFLDLERLIRTKWALPLRRLGLRGLTAFLLQRKLTKAQRMNNWEKAKITNAMKEYAAADAFVSLDLLDTILPKSKTSMLENAANAKEFKFSLALTVPPPKVEKMVASVRSRLGQIANKQGGKAKLEKVKERRGKKNEIKYKLTLTVPPPRLEKFVASLRSGIGSDAKRQGGKAKLNKVE